MGQIIAIEMQYEYHHSRDCHSLQCTLVLYRRISDVPVLMETYI